MTSRIRGLREKWYNRACCGVCCTRILTGGFRRRITSPADDKPCQGSGEMQDTRVFMQIGQQEIPGEKNSRAGND